MRISDWSSDVCSSDLQSVVVENRTGASGTIAGGELVHAKPDGYTLWISPQTAVAVAPQLLAKAPYDSLKDLTPITVIASSPLVLEIGRAPGREREWK